MTERLRHEIALLLAEDDGRADRSEARSLLRARLASSISEGLGRDAGVDHEGESAAYYDSARIAAFLDAAAVSPAERDAIVAALADDPVLRSDLASAATLIDSIEAEPAAMPPGLLTRALEVHAVARPPGALGVGGRRQPSGWWRGRPAVWSGLAAVILVAVATPVVLSVLWNNLEVVKPDSNDDAIGRGFPARPAAGKAVSPADMKTPAERATGAADAKSCDQPATADPRSGAAKSAEGATAEAGATKKNASEQAAPRPPDAAPDDPCRPKAPSDDGKADSRPPAATRD